MLHQAGNWVARPRLFLPNDAVARHRLAWHNLGEAGGAFWEMRAALLLGDTRKNAVYRRVIQVLDCVV